MRSQQSDPWVPAARRRRPARRLWLVLTLCVAVAGACRREQPDAPPAAAADSATVRGDSVAAREDTTVVQVSDTDTLITASNYAGWKPHPLDRYVQDSEYEENTVLDRRKGADGRVYLLVRSATPSRDGATRGYCAAGKETSIVWLAADSAMQVVRKAEVLVDSCLGSREVWSDSAPPTGELWRLRFRIHGDSLGTLATLEYDRRHPERGIRLTQVLDTTPM